MTQSTDTKRLIEALYARARDAENGCLIWQGSTATNGYGRVYVDGRMMPAHRRVLELSLGRRLPPGMEACHRCDVRNCIRAEHLFEGTRSDNMKDCAAKGRSAMQRHPEKNHLGTPSGRLEKARGEHHGSARLTADQVRAVRAEWPAAGRRYGWIAQRAAELGITSNHLQHILARKFWQHV